MPQSTWYLKVAGALALALALNGAANAGLVNQGDGTVLDDATGLVWLHNWTTNGPNVWGIHKAWADELVFAGHDDWALPSIDQLVALHTSFGYAGLTASFSNVLASNRLWWSGTETDASHAYRFRATVGSAIISGKGDTTYYAVAVRDSRAAVPEPHSLALISLALVAAAAVRRRRAD